MEKRRLAQRKLARSEHPEHHAVERPVRAGGHEERAEDEDRQALHVAEQPADEGKCARERQNEQPRLDDVPGREKHAAA
jgi:hypothetical protein